MDLGLQGKRVVVTGAAGGLGRAFALGFAAAGATVLAADVNTVGIAETAAKTGGHAQGVDVTIAASCHDLAAAAEAMMGGVDILVNNAAIYAGLARAPMEDLDEAVWDKVMAITAPLDAT